MARADNDFIYWKDAKEEFLQMIDEVALDLFMCPLGMDKYSSADMEKVSRINNDIAWNNEGVRDMANTLKQRLAGFAEEVRDADDV